MYIWLVVMKQAKRNMSFAQNLPIRAARKKAMSAVRARGEGKIIVDLGCGYYKYPGSIGIDNGVGFAAQHAKPDNLPDIFMDLNHNPLPFDENSIDEVRSSHFLEHSDVMHIIRESHRVLKSGGKFICTVPYANSAQGMYPGHSIFFTELWFKENLIFNDLFKIESFSFKPSPYWMRIPWILRKLIPFKLARIFLFNACHEMTLIARKK